LEASDSDTANLPLLAFVLDQLFQKRSDHRLSDKAYKTMGGITGAVAEHVKAVERQLRKVSGAKTAGQLAMIFDSLVLVREEGLPTRNRPIIGDFTREVWPLLDVLVNARLLRTEGEGAAATVSISHEKLFEAWPALRDYISANKKALMDRTVMNSRARKWADMGKPWFSGLASRSEQKEFRRGGALSPQAKDYLKASNRAWWIKMFGSVFLLSVFGVIGWAWQRQLSFEQVLLKFKSTVSQIQLEPSSMIKVQTGVFRMGDLEQSGNDIAQPVHAVTIFKPFKMGRFEVTSDEYDRFALATGNPLPTDRGAGRGRRPVVNVSWRDAQAYVVWLSAQTHKRYRLPTEAEWEYAVRNHGKDMAGDVFEWVEDCWHENYKGAPSDGRAWPIKNGGECSWHALQTGFVNEGPAWDQRAGPC
jgi:formylglycine-generating enzyme required for sulfatase activity